MTPTKTITISFEVPGKTDTPSEVLLRMKTLLLESLERQFHRDSAFQSSLSDEERALCKALLTES